MSNTVSIPIINKNILDATEQYIAQQTNCKTTYGKGLSAQIFKKFPDADIYAERITKGHVDEPGKIIVRGKVINMLAQFYPGKPRPPHDSYDMRKKWFADCLEEISNIHIISSVALPFNIGCGLAGGKWNEYLAMITEFQVKNPDIKVCLYKYEPPKSHSFPFAPVSFKY